MLAGDIKSLIINQEQFVKSFKGKQCTFKPTDAYSEDYGYQLYGVLAADYFGGIWAPKGNIYKINGAFYENNRVVYVVSGNFRYQTYQPNAEVYSSTLTLLVYGDKVNII